MSFPPDMFSAKPIFLAAKQTTQGGDTSAVRIDGFEATLARVRIEEEKELGTHTWEVGGYLGLA
jgi:hypothetical protein